MRFLFKMQSCFYKHFIILTVVFFPFWQQSTAGQEEQPQQQNAATEIAPSTSPHAHQEMQSPAATRWWSAAQSNPHILGYRIADSQNSADLYKPSRTNSSRNAGGSLSGYLAASPMQKGQKAVGFSTHVHQQADRAVMPIMQRNIFAHPKNSKSLENNIHLYLADHNDDLKKSSQDTERQRDSGSIMASSFRDAQGNILGRYTQVPENNTKLQSFNHGGRFIDTHNHVLYQQCWPSPRRIKNRQDILLPQPWLQRIVSPNNIHKSLHANRGAYNQEAQWNAPSTKGLQITYHLQPNVRLFAKALDRNNSNQLLLYKARQKVKKKETPQYTVGIAHQLTNAE